MTDSTATLLAFSLAGGLVGVIFGLAVFLWYAAALSRMFARRNVEPWRAWVPVLNEAEILRLGGRPAWTVVFFFLPVVCVYAIVLRALAAHRIGRTFGRGAGSTVLAVLLPPVWATVLASTREPAAVAERPPARIAEAEPATVAASVIAEPPVVVAPPVADLPPIRTPFMDAPAEERIDLDDVAATIVVERPAVATWTLVTDEGGRYPLEADVVVLGRRPAGEEPGVQYLAVSDTSRTLSKQHARLTREGDGWIVTDLQSTNGVFLDQDGAERQIAPGDAARVSGRLLLGTVGLRIEREGTR